MSDLELALLTFYAWLCGLGVGYIFWAPETRFRRAFVDGLSLKFIWGRWIK